MSADKLISFITNGNVEGPSKRLEVAEFQRTRFLHDCVIPWVVAVHEEEANGARSKTKLQITYEITDLLLYNAIGVVLQDTYDDEEVEDTNAFGREFEMRKYAILEYQSRESGGRERQHKRMKFDTSEKNWRGIPGKLYEYQQCVLTVQVSADKKRMSNTKKIARIGMIIIAINNFACAPSLSSRNFDRKRSSICNMWVA